MLANLYEAFRFHKPRTSIYHPRRIEFLLKLSLILLKTMSNNMILHFFQPEDVYLDSSFIFCIYFFQLCKKSVIQLSYFYHHMCQLIEKIQLGMYLSQFDFLERLTVGLVVLKLSVLYRSGIKCILSSSKFPSNIYVSPFF